MTRTCDVSLALSWIRLLCLATILDGPAAYAVPGLLVAVAFCGLWHNWLLSVGFGATGLCFWQSVGRGLNGLFFAAGRVNRMLLTVVTCISQSSHCRRRYHPSCGCRLHSADSSTSPPSVTFGFCRTCTDAALVSCFFFFFSRLPAPRFILFSCPHAAQFFFSRARLASSCVCPHALRVTPMSPQLRPCPCVGRSKQQVPRIKCVQLPCVMTRLC